MNIMLMYIPLCAHPGMLTHQAPIESQFTKGLVDHLNAEIVLGTVTNIKEASTWLSYTYLFVRMVKNPRGYGLTWENLLVRMGRFQYLLWMADFHQDLTLHLHQNMIFFSEGFVVF